MNISGERKVDLTLDTLEEHREENSAIEPGKKEVERKILEILNNSNISINEENEGEEDMEDRKFMDLYIFSGFLIAFILFIPFSELFFKADNYLEDKKQAEVIETTDISQESIEEKFVVVTPVEYNKTNTESMNNDRELDSIFAFANNNREEKELFDPANVDFEGFFKEKGTDLLNKMIEIFK